MTLVATQVYVVGGIGVNLFHRQRDGVVDVIAAIGNCRGLAVFQHNDIDTIEFQRRCRFSSHCDRQ